MVSLDYGSLLLLEGIPNFMTDPEKGKYFRVQANHVAPQGSKYSQENVKREQEQSRVRAFLAFYPPRQPCILPDLLYIEAHTMEGFPFIRERTNGFTVQKRKHAATIQQKKKSQTVQRSKVLSSSTVSGIALRREQGASHFLNYDARDAALAGQTQDVELLSLKSCESCGRRDKIHDFAVDRAANALVWGLGSQNSGRVQYVAE